MAAGFLERERMNEHRPRPSAQRRGDLARKQCRRRPRHEHLGASRVQQPAHEPLPSRHELDLVEAPQDGRAGRLGREQAGVFVENEAEVARGKIEQSLILERQVGHLRQGTAPGDDLGADLVQERGLPGATHPDDSRGLAGKPESTTNATGRVRRRWSAQRLGKLLAERLPEPGSGRFHYILLLRRRILHVFLLVRRRNS